MTREEAKQKLWSSGNINTLSKVECDDILNKVFDSLEQRNAELEQIVKELEEPKTCEGCEYSEYNYAHKCETCSRTIRNDYYKPKDTK